MSRRPDRFNVRFACFLFFGVFLAVICDAATVGTPTFSKAHGFYSSTISVRITSSTSGSTIRYTTDGSAPTSSHGTVLSNGGSVNIGSTRCLRAVGLKSGYTASKVFTQTYIFVDDVVQQPNTPPSGYPSSWVLEDAKDKVIAADYEMDPYIVNHSAYSGEIRGALKSIPTISLVMDRNDMFGVDGIYYEQGGMSHPDTGDKEEACSVELIYPDGMPSAWDGFQINCGIRRHSHPFAKRSFRLKFKAEYGPTKLDYPVFESDQVNADSAMTGGFDRLILRSACNDQWTGSTTMDPATYTLTRDEWARASQIRMSGIGSHGMFAHLYINGLYWGLYNLCERPDVSMTAAYMGGDQSDWFAVHHAGDISGNDNRYDYLHANAGNWSAVQSYIDAAEFSDYLILAWYDGNGDWPGGNWYAGNCNDPAGKVMYFTWDAEKSWYNFPNQTVYEGGWVNKAFLVSTSRPIPKLWQNLWKSSDFRMIFADRIYKHCYNGGALTESNARSRWMTLADWVEDAIICESARWGDWRDAQTAGSDVNGSYVHDSDGTYPVYQRDKHWKPARDRIYNMMNGNVSQFMTACRSKSWGGYPVYPSLNPPVYSKHGGSVSSGYSLTISRNNSSGTIFYRTDGDDPRVDGGSVRSGTSSASSSKVLTLTATSTVKARVKNDGTWSALANATFTVTGGTPPAAPSSPAAVAQSTSQIRVTWHDNSSNESGFKVDRRQSGADDWIRVQTTGANVTAYTDTGLPAATKYYYQVKAYNASGNSAYTPIVAATTEDDTPAPAIAVSTTSISVSCQQGTDAASATFEVWNGGGGTLSYSVVESTSYFSVAPTSGSSTGSADKQTHTITFTTAAKGVGVNNKTITIEDDGSGASNGPITIDVTITITEAPPPTPTGLTAAALSTSQIRLTWNDVSGETQYKIRRSSDGVDFYALSAVFPTADTTSWTDTGLAAGETRYYKIRAENAAGSSAYSAAVDATTDSYVPAIAVSTTQISVNCMEGTDAADATFQVWNGGTGTLDYKLVEWSSKFSIAPTTGSSGGSGDKQTHTIDFASATLAVGVYDRTFMVEDNGSGASNGPITIDVQITVTQGVPAAPSGLAAVALSSSEARLSWQDNSDNEDGFKIDRASNSSFSDAVRVVLTAVDATRYTDSGLDPSTTYFYRVKADNVTGSDSPYSNTAEVTTPADGPVTMFEAYNDLGWESGQTSANITTLTVEDSGSLVDHATGAGTAVTLAISGGTKTDMLRATRGVLSAAGTEAATVFDGKLDAVGLIQAGTDDNLVFAFSGMDPSLRYELVLFGNRDVEGYAGRITEVTLSDVAEFVNRSSPGADYAGLSDAMCRIGNGWNTDRGCVVRFAGILCGADGDMRVSVSAAAGSAYLNALMLKATSGAPAEDTDEDVIPDVWEEANFAGDDADPAADPDGDGVSNAGEFVAGTDPNSAQAGEFLAVALSLSGGNLTVSFPTIEATGTGYAGLQRYYALEASAPGTPELWQAVAGYERILGANQTVSYQLPAAEQDNPRCYRARVWLED